MRLPHAGAAALAAAMIALVAVGLTQLTGSRKKLNPGPRIAPAEMASRLAGSSAPLAALHRQSGQVLGGGGRALRARLRALRGYPMVINKWASWCAPCRAEFGAFQTVSLRYGRQVAFLGLDSAEPTRAGGAAFLRSFSVSYPSYYDATGRLGQQITGSGFTPVTVFITREGQRYIHQGPYPDASKLERDVRRYALHA